MTAILGVLLACLAGACCYWQGEARGYREGFQDGYGARWGGTSPGDAP